MLRARAAPRVGLVVPFHVDAAGRAPTQLVDEASVGDREDEGTELLLVPREAIDRIEDGEEHLARQILGFAGAARPEESHHCGCVVDPQVGARPRRTRLRREQHAGKGIAAHGATGAAARRRACTWRGRGQRAFEIGHDRNSVGNPAATRPLSLTGAFTPPTHRAPRPGREPCPTPGGLAARPSAGSRRRFPRLPPRRGVRR